MGKKHKPIPFKPILLLGTELLNIRIRYFGHIVRCHKEDPLRLTTLHNKKLKGNLHRRNRVGRPRTAWVYVTARASWHKVKHKFGTIGAAHLVRAQYDSGKKEHRKKLKKAALNRWF